MKKLLLSEGWFTSFICFSRELSRGVSCQFGWNPNKAAPTPNILTSLQSHYPYFTTPPSLTQYPNFFIYASLLTGTGVSMNSYVSQNSSSVPEMRSQSLSLASHWFQTQSSYFPQKQQVYSCTQPQPHPSSLRQDHPWPIRKQHHQDAHAGCGPQNNRRNFL